MIESPFVTAVEDQNHIYFNKLLKQFNFPLWKWKQTHLDKMIDKKR